MKFEITIELVAVVEDDELATATAVVLNRINDLNLAGEGRWRLNSVYTVKVKDE